MQPDALQRKDLVVWCDNLAEDSKRPGISGAGEEDGAVGKGCHLEDFAAAPAAHNLELVVPDSLQRSKQQSEPRDSRITNSQDQLGKVSEALQLHLVATGFATAHRGLIGAPAKVQPLFSRACKLAQHCLFRTENPSSQSRRFPILPPSSIRWALLKLTLTMIDFSSSRALDELPAEPCWLCC